METPWKLLALKPRPRKMALHGIYLTTEQKPILRRTISCVRLVFNKALAATAKAQ
ncbi:MULTISPECIES: helix-turn-helix domain-containing protein [Calothrix]|uniref:helix-turn-helix domain-containing protein n=1 Tax=Calothrix TaxID=1186 RepID=UPI001F550FE0|nr:MULTISPECIES: helix-turn-helix domain-containing protein [Calothrix]